MRSMTLATLAAALLATACASTPSDDVDFADLLGEMTAGVPKERSDRIAATLADKPLGSAENPIRVYMPEGQRAYLHRLRCADGRAPAFVREGSMGMSPYGQIVDAYAVTCEGSTPARSTVFLDMYHPAHTETQAPPGFTIRQ